MKKEFKSDSYYHIYNRSIGSELLFRHEKDYEYFQLKMDRYLSPLSEVISYCLIPNHFHLLIRVKDTPDLPAGADERGLLDGRKSIEQALKNFFNSYTKSYNIAHNRYGKLFQHGYKTKEITSEEYLFWLIYYIHRNPVHHNLTDNCHDWAYSSYNEIVNEKDKNRSNFIFNLYGNKNEFIDFVNEMTSIYKSELFNTFDNDFY